VCPETDIVPVVNDTQTAASVAAEIKMSSRTVKRWCRDGKIATVGKLAGPNGAWLIGPEGLEQARRLADITKQLTTAHQVAS